MLRFVDWLAECQPSSPVVTVVNKVPSSRFSAAEVVEQLRSLCGDRIEVAATVPFDRRVVAAEWDATLPARGPFTRALAPWPVLATWPRSVAVVVSGGPLAALLTDPSVEEVLCTAVGSS